MSISVWGIDHGIVSKKMDNWGVNESSAASWSLPGNVLRGPVGGGVTSGAVGAMRAKEGRKAAVGTRVGGRSALEGTVGGAVGGLAGRALTRGNKAGAAIGAAGGSLAGSAHGAGAAMHNARRRKDLKNNKKW